MEERKTSDREGLKFSDFKILRIIGTGTFGKVFLALLNEKPVALKSLKKVYIIQMK